MLVLWANHTSPNLGVRVLAEGAAALARMAYPGAHVEFHNFGRTDGPGRLGRPRDVARELLTRRLGFERWIREFDVVLDTRSGDSFADIYGLSRHSVMTGIAEMVTRAEVPLVMAPQTIGPFETRRGRAMARRTLRRAALVMARDPVSASASSSLGRPADIMTTDLVFALDQPTCTSVRRDVVLNVSGLLWQGGTQVDAQHYRQMVAEVFSGLRERGRDVALLAHVVDSPHPDNDAPAIREFAAGLDDAVEVLEPADLAEARQIVAGAELVLGSRMHACLNALSVGTPAIALAYSRKFAPLMHDLDWPCCVDLGTRDDASSVLAMVDEQDWSERARSVQAEGQARLAVAADLLRATLEERR